MPNVPILKWFIVLFKTKLVENETERAKKKVVGGGAKMHDTRCNFFIWSHIKVILVFVSVFQAKELIWSVRST